MKANHQPTTDELRLGATTPRGNAKDSLAAAIGDPAYLHEMKGALDPWSRKQIEKAANALLETGAIVRYGVATRRLYASRREVPAVLSDIPAAHVRLLQYMPFAGAVRIETLNDLMSESAAMVTKLVATGFVIRIPAVNDLVMLSVEGAQAKATLGEGLALPPIDMDELEDATPLWWSSLIELAATGSLARQNQRTSALVRLGLARKIKDGVEITADGRRVHDARRDLEAITRLIDDNDENAAVEYGRRAREEGMKKTPPPAAAAPDPTGSDDRAYLLLRTDIDSMGIGKSRSQSMHAGNQMTHDVFVVPLEMGRVPHPRIVAWHAQGRGFGTAIAIGARNQVTLPVLQKTIEYASRLGFPAGLVIDETYPYEVSNEVLPLIDKKVHAREPVKTRGGWRCFRRETTAGWVFGNKDELGTLLAQFDLTPGREEGDRY